MGRRELLDALQREGQETLTAIAAREEAEEKRLRTDCELRLAELRREQERQRDLRCQERKLTVVSAAKRQAALVRLRAEHELSLRLLERARLQVMTPGWYDPERLFQGLLAELPTAVWRSVRVNPVFAPLARECFPGTEIVGDPALAGGFRVVSADGSLEIDSTLDKRLERSWPDLLPQLFAGFREESAGAGTEP